MTEDYIKSLIADPIISEILKTPFDRIFNNHHLYKRLYDDGKIREKVRYERSYINNNYANPSIICDYYDSYTIERDSWNSDYCNLITKLIIKNENKEI